MEINLNKKSSTEALIKVSVKKADYQPEVEKKVKDYAKKASVKGFRPGKVPPGLINKMYGKSILVEEVNNLVSKNLSEYIREQKLQVLGNPLPDKSMAAIDWDTQEDFEFEYNIGFVNEVYYDLSKKQKVKKYSIDIDDKTLEKTLVDIKKRFGTDIEADTSESGDLLEVDIHSEDGQIDNKEVSFPVDAVEKKEQKKFIGLKRGDEVSFDLKKTFSDVDIIKTLTGIHDDNAGEIKGKFTLKVNGVKRRKEAEMDQALFDQVFGKDAVKDEKEFNAKVTETIQANYDKETETFFNHSIRKQLLASTSIELPDNFLKEWLKVDQENVTDEDIEREYDGYAESLKWSLITEKIIADKEIKVEYDEVKEKARSMFVQQFGGEEAIAGFKDSLDPVVDNYLQGENGKNYRTIYEQVMGEKTFELIKGEITISEKKVKLDEFTKVVEKENA